jgi:hypothetical protein
MCKIAFIAADPKTPADARHRAVAQVLKNGWDMGNTDGVGFVTWGDGVPLSVGKALKLGDLKGPSKFGAFTLLHVRAATTPKTIENTHPLALDDAYIVHNGIVSIEKADDATIGDLCKTTCDSEKILAAYLAEKRDLARGMRHIAGMSNVMLWDAQRKVLSVYPDSAPFMFWRQDGILCLVQVQNQTNGVVVSGLGRPYEYEALDDDRIYEFPLETDTPDWAALIEKARESSVPHKRNFAYRAPLNDDWEGRHQKGAYYHYGGSTGYGSGLTAGQVDAIRNERRALQAELRHAETPETALGILANPDLALTKRDIRAVRKWLGGESSHLSNDELKLLIESYRGVLESAEQGE